MSFEKQVAGQANEPSTSTPTVHCAPAVSSDSTKLESTLLPASMLSAASATSSIPVPAAKSRLSNLDIVLIVVAIFFPCIPMGVKKGFGSAEFWICLICEVLVIFHIPVVIWTIYTIFKTPSSKIRDAEAQAQDAADLEEGADLAAIP